MPRVEPTYEVGVVIRWSEQAWKRLQPGEGVLLIDLGDPDVEGTIRKMLSCRKIVSSSLHGLILADAYGIPNAWLATDDATGGSRPMGGEFKFYDYFLSVDKERHAQDVDLLKLRPSSAALLNSFDFDDRGINFDPERLLSACPVP